MSLSWHVIIAENVGAGTPDEILCLRRRLHDFPEFFHPRLTHIICFSTLFLSSLLLRQLGFCNKGALKRKLKVFDDKFELYLHFQYS